MTDKPTRAVQAAVPIQAYLSLEAIRDTFSGRLTDDEAGRLLRRTFTLTAEDIMAVDAVCQSPDTDFTYFSEFVRSAVVQLVMAYVAAGFPDKAVSETMRSVQNSRKHAARLAIRGRFQDDFATMEQALVDWTGVGDWTAIDKELEYLDGLVADTRDMSQTWAFRMEAIVTKSTAVTRAINGLHEAWSRSRKKKEKEAAEKWVAWLESLT